MKSELFATGVTTRIVNFMFLDSSAAKKREVIEKIVNSSPQTWADILVQIVFSKEYLLNTAKVKGIEETSFPLMKKFSYNAIFIVF